MSIISISPQNPADVVATIDETPAESIATIVDTARAAQRAWRASGASTRSTALTNAANALAARADEAAALLVREVGKPAAEAAGEVGRAVAILRYYAQASFAAKGDMFPPSAKGFLWSERRPHGVAGLITPWNFPLAMITRKVAPALAAGCPVIIKPSELTPLTALAATELAVRAGIPAGVLNVLTADSDHSIAIGKAFCASDIVRHISFTGSTEVGRLLMAQSAPTIKKLALELGGNAPFLVFDDADLDSAVEGAMLSKYRNAGQTCVCANRFYVQSGIYDAFVERFTQKVKTLKVGNGFEAEVNQGPLIEPAALEKVKSHVADAVAKGARVLTGGKPLHGQFFEPTLVADAKPDMLCAKEETFGPFAPIFKFDTEAQAIAAANHTEFGLASYVYTRDLGRMYRVSEALEYGMVGVNVGILATEHVPFGGMKQSGLGREGSRHGMTEYLEMKYVCVGDVLKTGT